MRRRVLGAGVVVLSTLIGSCDPSGTVFTSLPVETRFAFVNLSRTFYATIRVCDGAASNESCSMAPLLAPGAIFREDFRKLVGTGCPDSVDLRLLLYRRIDDTLPIGLDESEAVEAVPIVAGEIAGVPACAVQPLVSYTVVNWDADPGVARVKIAQNTLVDEQIRMSGIFPNKDAAWEIHGVASSLATAPPPLLLSVETIAGKVTAAAGSGVAGIGVLLRTRFRVRLDDDDAENDPDVGFSDPIAFTVTDDSGAFSFDRPPGGYQIEFFSDDFEFRPASVALETPIEVVQVLAEPL